MIVFRGDRLYHYASTDMDATLLRYANLTNRQPSLTNYDYYSIFGGKTGASATLGSSDVLPPSIANPQKAYEAANSALGDESEITQHLLKRVAETETLKQMQQGHFGSPTSQQLQQLQDLPPSVKRELETPRLDGEPDTKRAKISGSPHTQPIQQLSMQQPPVQQQPVQQQPVPQQQQQQQQQGGQAPSMMGNESTHSIYWLDNK